MSNVLIGIIGVILFIGLALAGALFLGPRFQETQIDSKASAGIAAITQLANAMTLMRLQEGRPFDASLSLLPGTNPTTSPVSMGYLKVLPKGPVNTIYDGFVVDKDTQRTGEPKFAVMVLERSTDELAGKVCLAMVRRTGQDPTATAVPASNTLPDVPAGCIRAVGSASVLNSGNYYFFARI